MYAKHPRMNYQQSIDEEQQIQVSSAASYLRLHTSGRYQKQSCAASR